MRNYGEYAVRNRGIELKMEPMAAVRFKRLFEKVEKHAAEWLHLSATPENAREVEWFMDRYPLVAMTQDDASRLDELARAFDRAQAMIAQIRDPNYVPHAVDLAEPPRPYQLIPAAMLKAMPGVLCGDDVGLGKTVEAIVALADPNNLPAVIVSLTHMPKQIQREINRFAPGLNTYVLKTGTPYRNNQDFCLAKVHRQGGLMPDVVITSYSKLAGWAEWLVRYFKPSFVVWDEVQEFRAGFEVNKASKKLRNRSGLYLATHVERRLSLSATPIHNYGRELWPVIEATSPGALGDRLEFQREWCDQDGIVKEPKVLGSYLEERGLFIRRTKEDVGRELPPLTISEQFCDADPGVIMELKRSSRAIDLAKFVLSGTRDAFQASGEFDMFVRQQTGIAKAPFVAAFVEMLLESDEPVVLFAWHHQVYDIWRDLLAKHNPAFFTGKEKAKQKDEAKRRFCSGETKLFIISLRSGAGIDGLQYAGCSNGVLGELDWSPAVIEQCIGRIRRDGLLTPMTLWVMVSSVGSDPVMAEKLGVKRGQLEGIRDTRKTIVSGQTDPDAIKRLAAHFLQKSGVDVPNVSKKTKAPRNAQLFKGALV